jgi:iron complex transport system substrate-binding protein
MRTAVSLVPSATDITLALGAGELLLGISADCDQPGAESDAPLPVVTRPMIDPSRAAVDPAGVDAAVRDQMAAGGLLYSLDVEAVVALAPDVVFAQDSCSVCALPSAEVVAALGRAGLSCEIVSLDPVDLEGVLATFSTVGLALGLKAEGAALEASCRARLDWLMREAAQPGAQVGVVVPGVVVPGVVVPGVVVPGVVVPGVVVPGVVVLDWVDPPFVAGNWVPDLVRAAGGEPLLSVAGQPSHEISIDDLEASKPNVIVVAPCGLDLGAAQQQAGALERALRARRVAAGAGSGAGETSADAAPPRIVAFDGRLWFSRPGPRLVDGAEALAAWLAGATPTGAVTSIEITEAAT